MAADLYCSEIIVKDMFEIGLLLIKASFITVYTKSLKKAPKAMCRFHMNMTNN